MKREGHTQQGKREEREGGPGWKRRRKKVANAIYEERDRKGKGKDGSFLQVERERESYAAADQKNFGNEPSFQGRRGRGIEGIPVLSAGRPHLSKEIGGEDRYHSTQHTRYVRYFLKQCQVL